MADSKNYAELSLSMHREKKGKIEVVSTVPVNDADDLSIAYTPGVAQPCLEIQKDPLQSYELTRRWNMCAVITDGTAVLGLGDIGPEASMPVMEGKCVLFKSFGDVDAFPLCVDSKDVDTFVNTVAMIHKSFGGINLEDISAPRLGKSERPVETTAAPAAFASSGKISGIGLAHAKIIASLFMLSTISLVRRPGAETPINISAPFITSARLPFSIFLLVFVAISSLIQFMPSARPL